MYLFLLFSLLIYYGLKSAAGKGKQWDPVRRKMVDVGLNLYQQKMSVKKTVDELLFTGYSDDMLDMARAMPLFGKDVEVPFDRFGWFYTVIKYSFFIDEKEFCKLFSSSFRF